MELQVKIVTMNGVGFKGADTFRVVEVVLVHVLFCLFFRKAFLLSPYAFYVHLPRHVILCGFDLVHKLVVMM